MTKLLVRAQPFVLPVLFFSVLINLLRLTIPLYMLQVIDRVLSSESVETLVSISLVAAGALVTSAILTGASGVLQTHIGTWMDEKLFRNVVQGTLSARGAHDPRKSSGPVRELGQLRQFFSSPVISTLLEVPWTIVFIGILYYLHPYLGVLATVAAVVLLAVSIAGETVSQSRTRKGQADKEIAVEALEAAAQSGDSVRAMGMQSRLSAKMERQNQQASRQLFRAARGNTTVQSTTRFLRTLAQIGILGFGGYLVLQDAITMGIMIAGSILLGLALSPIDKSVGAIKSLRGARRSVALLNAQLAKAGPEEPAEAPPMKGGPKIALRQAMFMPPGLRRPVLRPLTFDIAPGQCIGVVGPVASGKSTLCRLLAGVIAPGGGSVQINEVEASRLAGGDFGDQLGYLGQDDRPLLGTVAENVSRFVANPDTEVEAKVSAAIRMSGVTEAVLALPQGLQTEIGRAGEARLSRGQTQQVLIARAFYGDPGFILLDEPASYLDKAGETALAGALDHAKRRGATIVLVTQRPNLLQKCDKLVYLRDGNLVAFGDREQVLEKISKGDVVAGPRRIGDQGQRRGGARN